MADPAERSEDGSPSCSPCCSQPTEWGGEAAQLLGNASLELNSFVGWFPHQLDRPTCSILFREGVEKTLKFDCAKCFVVLCRKHCERHSYEFYGKSWNDLKFAYSCAATQRPHFLSAIGKEKIEKQNASETFKLGELKLLIGVALKAGIWTALSVLFRVKMDGHGLDCDSELSVSHLHRHVDDCFAQVLTDEASWTDIAPVLDMWVRHREGEMVKKLVKSVQGRVKRESWSVDVMSRAKQWCVNNGHANLAFVLALVTEDWDRMEMVTSMPSLDLHYSTLLGAAEMVVKPTEQGGSSSAGSAILAICPITREILHSLLLARLKGSTELVRACEQRGLWDYALMIQCYNGDTAYLSNCHQFCQNRLVPDWIMERTIFTFLDTESTDLALALLKGCMDPETLRRLLHGAVNLGRMNILEALLNHADPSTYILDENDFSLLFTAVNAFGDGEKKKKCVRRLLATGLSAFQRDVDATKTPRFSWNGLQSFCALKRAFWKDLPDIVDMTLGCGCYSHKTLKACADDAEIKRRAKNEKLRKCFERVQEAARTPTRLELLVRLAVCRSVGCRPGREERINKLPLPVPLKGKVKFNDILYPVSDNIQQMPEE